MQNWQFFFFSITRRILPAKFLNKRFVKLTCILLAFWASKLGGLERCSIRQKFKNDSSTFYQFIPIFLIRKSSNPNNTFRNTRKNNILKFVFGVAKLARLCRKSQDIKLHSQFNYIIHIIQASIPPSSFTESARQRHLGASLYIVLSA